MESENKYYLELLKEKSFENFLELIDEALKKDPKDVNALRDVIKFYLNKRIYHKALIHLVTFLEIFLQKEVLIRESFFQGDYEQILSALSLFSNESDQAKDLLAGKKSQSENLSI